MSVNRVRLGSAFLALLSLGLVFSCKQSPAPDPKGDLIGSLKGADVEGYSFSLNEEDAKTTAALTNPAVRNVSTLGKGDAGLVLRYTSVEDKKANKRTVYKSEIIKQDSTLSLAVTDLATNQVVDKWPFPTPGPTCQPEGQFDSINACIAEFNCFNQGRLLCQANRTCDPQFAALTCCLKDGTRVSVHLIYRPTRLICQLKDLIPDLEGLVLSQN